MVNLPHRSAAQPTPTAKTYTSSYTVRFLREFYPCFAWFSITTQGTYPPALRLTGSIPVAGTNIQNFHPTDNICHNC